MSLATEYRPQEFSEVVGQQSIVQILERQLELGKTKNAYIFSGSSGCGKTTCARIFANRYGLVPLLHTADLLATYVIEKC